MRPRSAILTCVEKSIRFDRHARRRMKWRRISQTEVEEIIARPDEVGPTRAGRATACKMIGGRRIRVPYTESEDEILVITAAEKEVRNEN